MSTIKDLGIESPLIHAEEVETSLAMGLEADVREEELTQACFNRCETYKAKGIPTSRHIAYDALSPGSGVLLPMDYIDDISDSGVVGDACSATRSKGKKLIDAIEAGLVELVEDLRKT